MPCGGDIEETLKGQGGFVVSDRDVARLLEMVDHPLDAVAVSGTPPFCFL